MLSVVLSYVKTNSKNDFFYYQTIVPYYFQYLNVSVSLCVFFYIYSALMVIPLIVFPQFTASTDHSWEQTRPVIQPGINAPATQTSEEKAERVRKSGKRSRWE